MFLRQITDPSLAQNAYLIGCQRTGEAILTAISKSLRKTACASPLSRTPISTPTT